MPTRISAPIGCEYGYAGYQRRSENDQLFSRLWESYGHEGFCGYDLMIMNYGDMPNDFFAASSPSARGVAR